MENKIKHKNILSIVIDYILEPFIEYCEHDWSESAWMVSYKEMLDDPVKIFDRLHNFGPLIRKASHISEKNYEEVMDLYTQALFSLRKKEHTKLYFANNHCTILTPLKKMFHDLDDYEKSNTKFRIINIDHHHDVYYSLQQTKEVDLYNAVSQGDWMWYMDKIGLCDEYYWIGNENSEAWKDLRGTGAPHYMQNGGHYTSLADFDKDGLRPKKYDLIYVCCSPQWNPAMYHSYFYILKNMAEKYFKKELPHDKGFYCGGRYSNEFFEEKSNELKLDRAYSTDAVSPEMQETLEAMKQKDDI